MAFLKYLILFLVLAGCGEGILDKLAEVTTKLENVWLVEQRDYLKSSNPNENDFLGWSLSIDINSLIVGSITEDSNATGVNGDQANNDAGESGAAYIFNRQVTTWSQQAYLKASNAESGDSFGYSVAISGDTAVVGAPYEASNATGINGNQSDNSAGGSGAVYVFTRSGSSWSQQAYLKASNAQANDNFGFSVAIDGDTIVVGAPQEDSNATGVAGNQSDNSAGGSGAVYVFYRSGSTWSQQAYLKASNTEANDNFGNKVAISENTVAVGASVEDSGTNGINGDQSNNNASGSGAVYVFNRTGSSWTQQAYLKASNTGADDNFGYSLDIYQDTLVVSSPGEDSGSTGVNKAGANNNAAESGAAYVFRRTNGQWLQQAYLKASNTGSEDRFGWSVAISKEGIVIGAFNEESSSTGIDPETTDDSTAGAGAAYLFVYNVENNAWEQLNYIKASAVDANDNFGSVVDISNNTISISSPYEDSSSSGVSGDPTNNGLSGTGAVFIFQ